MKPEIKQEIQAILAARLENHILPDRVYRQFKPFFSDAQLTTLYKTAINSLKKFDLDAEQQMDAIVYGMESLVKAMKRYHKNAGEPVYNIYAYLNRKLLHVGYNGEIYDDIYAYTDAERFRKILY